MHEHEDDGYSNKAEACEAADDIAINPDVERSIGAVIARRYSRRDMLKGSLGVTAATALFGAAALGAGRAAAQQPATSAGEAVFAELAAGVDERHHVADGYTAEVLLRWGDPLFPGMAPFDPRTLTGDEQARRFGYNNDYVAFLADRRCDRSWAPLRQSRVHQPRSHVPRRPARQPDRFFNDHSGSRRGRDGGARRRPWSRSRVTASAGIRCSTAHATAASPRRRR